MKMDFQDITLKVKKFSKDTVAEVQKMTDVRQCKSQISAEKKRINAMYAEIGKKLYDQYREAPLEGFESDFRSLGTAFETIEELRGQIRMAKGVVLCPNCRMEVSIYERFCSNCGCKMPEVITIEGEERHEIPQADILQTEEPADEPAAETSEEPVEPASEPAAETSEEPETAEPTDEPAAEASEGMEEPADEPAADTTPQAGEVSGESASDTLQADETETGKAPGPDHLTGKDTEEANPAEEA